MPDSHSLPPPWQLCDHSCRITQTALRLLDAKRVHDGISYGTLAVRSGMHPMAVTKMMQGLAGNLAEFICLAAALQMDANVVLCQAMHTTPQGDPRNAA